MVPPNGNLSFHDENAPVFQSKSTLYESRLLRWRISQEHRHSSRKSLVRVIDTVISLLRRARSFFLTPVGCHTWPAIGITIYLENDGRLELLQASAIRAAQVELKEVAAFPTQQVTGVTVSAKGRVFVNFPFWSDDHTISVAEVADGKPKPFPDEAWNEKAAPSAQRWICVQSVVVDDQDALWVLDPPSPETAAVVKGGLKLVKIDLAQTKSRKR